LLLIVYKTNDYDPNQCMQIEAGLDAG